MIETTQIKEQYSPLTPTTVYPFGIAYFESSDINVSIVDALGVETVLVLNAVSDGFVVVPVNGNTENGATIITTETYTTGEVVTLFRDVPLTQLNEFQRGGDLPSEVVNVSLDRGVAISQQISDTIDRAVTAPITDPDGLNYELPVVALRAGKVFGADALGNTIAVDLAQSGAIGVDTDKGLAINNNIISTTVDGSSMGWDSEGKLEVADNGITEDKMANNSVGNSELINANVTANKMYTGSSQVVFGNTTGSSGAVEVPIVGATGILIDDDTFAAPSALKGATQQSIKAYVDTEVAAEVDKYAMQYINTSIGPLSPTASWVDIDLFDGGSGPLPNARCLVVLELYDCSTAADIKLRRKGSNLEMYLATNFSGQGSSGGVCSIGDEGFVAVLVTDANAVIQIKAGASVSGINAHVISYQLLH